MGYLAYKDLLAVINLWISWACPQPYSQSCVAIDRIMKAKKRGCTWEWIKGDGVGPDKVTKPFTKERGLKGSGFSGIRK